MADFDLRFSDTLMLAAVLLGPIMAVQVQRLLERIREQQKGRLDVFFTLMATRMSRVSAVHVEALNRIDLEFYGTPRFWRRGGARKFREVRAAWTTYREQLNLRFNVDDSKQLEAWAIRKDDLFVALLHAMSNSLGYGFDKDELRRAVYAPVAHSDEDQLLKRIRTSLADVMEGKRPIKMKLERE